MAEAAKAAEERRRNKKVEGRLGRWLSEKEREPAQMAALARTAQQSFGIDR